ncbi:M14 family zinc carboxypeptidase [Empedobacter brevis]|uniref:M14 family zinc carboxypeptidase n=1 Tax=Empedobacter brevis TaxID=247 RepID=UPI00289E6681|nr:M14 family zinc carboxypeptidase [Empedobacter brevis]
MANLNQTVAPLSTIISWFSEGAIPTDVQFETTWKSFFHKSENIPVEQIYQLTDILNQKAERDHVHLDLAKRDGSNLSVDDINGLKEVLGVALAANGIVSNIETTITAEDANVLQDGIYKPKTSGNYVAINLIANEGYSTLFRKKDGIWSIFSEDKLPSLKLMGLANDLRTSINFDGVANIVTFGNSFFVIYNNQRVVAVDNQTINLSSNPSVLYILPNGNINTRETTLLSSLPADAVIFASYSKITTTTYEVVGLTNYSLNGIPQRQKNYFIGEFIGYENGLNFDTVANKISISSTNVVLYSNKRILLTPQVQEIELATSGIYCLYVTQEGLLGSILQSSIANIPFGSVLIGSYFRTSSTGLLIQGVDNYSLNGINQQYLKKGVGKLISNSNSININGQKLEIKGQTMLVVGRTRYNVSAQTIDFSSFPSVFYFVPSTGLIGTAQSGAITMPADAIIFGGHMGAIRGRRFEIWGIEDYSVKGFDKKTWQYKLVQKKLLTDFDPTSYYYKSETTLSMTDTDAQPLIGSDPNIMRDRYTALLNAHPTLISKEVIATIPTTIGNRFIEVYTFTPPTVSTATRPDGGKIVIEQPHIFINCSIHGSEKTASIACYQFLEDILNKWQTNKVLEWFRFNIKLSIIPTANPQGWVNGARPNSNGVDLNRNFPYLHIPNQNAGTEQWSGLSPLDQPESLAINTWVENNKESLLLGVDFHNFFGTVDSEPNLLWTEGVNQFTNQLGRIAAQRVSRGSRNSSSFFPIDYNKLLGTASYVSTTNGRLAGQMNDIIPYALTFEVSQNFRYDPNFKPNDNNTIRLSTEAFGNSLTHFVWNCIQDFNSKTSTYQNL